MNKLIWKFRFARRMQERVTVSFMFGWKSAGAWLEAYPDALNDCPVDACDEELSYWECG